jgi:hypothetical protein
VSVDFYVAMPAAHWPTTAAVNECLEARGYPVLLQRFPAFATDRAVTDGALAMVDGKDQAYLEGDLLPAKLARQGEQDIVDQMSATPDSKWNNDSALLSFRLRSPAEVTAASYLISALIVCFHGYGFEPQGRTGGRDEFAQNLIAGAQALKGL